MSNTQHSTQIERFAYDDKDAFLDKLKSIVDSGIASEQIETLTPFHVHEADHLLKSKVSQLRFFTLTGAVSGFLLSFLFIVFTVLDWPLITGGKPLISIPAYIIVAFECTILIGGIVSFIGFLHLNRLPNIKAIVEPRECGTQFVILQRPKPDGENK